MPLLKRLSIRTHILSVVLIGAIAPLVLIGVWLTASAVRSGKTLLDEQLNTSLDAVADRVAQKWAFRQGDLLLLAENSVARQVVVGAALARADSQYLSHLQSQVAPGIPAFAYLDLPRRVRWKTRAPEETRSLGSSNQAPARPARTIAVSYPVQDSAGGVIGHLDAQVALDGLIPADSGRLGVPGAVLGVRDRAKGDVLLAMSPETGFMADGTMRIGAVEWRSMVRRIEQPPIDLAVAAPVAPYVTPFEHAGRIGLVAVGVVALVALLLSTYLTVRLTAPIERLAEASAAIARGDVAGRVDGTGPAEIETLTTSFNTMTDSLKRTMNELSRTSALAAVGEFAASLAHEIRNALTSVRVDLQRAEEKIPVTEAAADLVTRSLATVTRLDATMTGALGVARSGQTKRHDVELRDIVAAAARDASPTFTERRVTLDMGTLPSDPLTVRGDPDALRQLFLNLFLNAGQASMPGNRASLSSARSNGHVVVSITDNGVGIAGDDLLRVFQPFFTTRSVGTGLGLPIARQIAIAHGGDIAIESALGQGTVVRVQLPTGEGP